MFDIIEFVLAKHGFDAGFEEKLKRLLNTALTVENSAYRIVGREVIEITDEKEIVEIETALEKQTTAVQIHLQHAIEKLSDRQNADFRNSIKEAISAVEAMCQLISGQNNATLPDSLKALRDRQALHPAFEQALIKLYAYTSDYGGIRHAVSDGQEKVSYADAKFMLVTCAAYINFLWAKASELNIPIKQ